MAHNNTAPTPLTPPGGITPAPGEAGLPIVEAHTVADVESVENRTSGATLLRHGKTDSDAPAITEDLEMSDNRRSEGLSHARDSLGSRASVSETDAELAHSDAPVDYADLDVPGADLSDDVRPLDITSTPEELKAAHDFFEGQKAVETAAQVKRARTLSRVFSIMQYRHHQQTGALMLTQEQLDAGFALLGDRLHRYAYIWHDSDRLVEVDDGTGEFTCIGLKGLHVHLVLWFNSDDRPTVRTVSDAFAIPSARVRVPNEIAAQDGREARRGRNAAEKAFFDFVEYLTHESRRRGAIRGVTQPDRFYLVDDRQAGNPGKYQYGRGRVVANFDFARELDAHMAGRVSAAQGSTGLRARKLKLRRAVMDGMSLLDARDKDRDAYADDLPRLRELARECAEIAGAEIAGQIGSVWRKSLVVTAAATRQGKDTFLEELGKQLMWLASLAGFDWSCVKPAGRNTLEGIGRAQIVHHEDMRYKLVPDYDEGLRYFDPNQAIEAGTRFTNTAAPTPRVIMASTSETLLSLGYTLKRRASSEYLAEQAASRATAPRYPLDVDEFLYRIGWYVEVAKPDEAGDNVDAIREGMLVSIYRVRETSEEHRVERAFTRGGDHIGDVRTQHRLEAVAMIRGCENAARFLAVSIIQERNADVVEAIPAERMADLVAGQLEIETGARALEAQREAERNAALAEAERCERARLLAEQQKRIAELEKETRRRELCTCARFPTGYQQHEDVCPLVSDEERARRAEGREQQLTSKVRSLGLVLPGDSSPASPKRRSGATVEDLLRATHDGRTAS